VYLGSAALCKHIQRRVSLLVVYNSLVARSSALGLAEVIVQAPQRFPLYLPGISQIHSFV
jgi:hypothetical protein